jgi:hypothetical protein
MELLKQSMLMAMYLGDSSDAVIEMDIIYISGGMEKHTQAHL